MGQFCTEREKKADAAAGPHWQRSVFEQLQIPTAEMKWNFQLHFGVTPLCHRQVHYPVTASPPDGQRRTKAMSEALCSTKAVLINHKVGRTFLETRNSNDQMCNQVRGKHTIMTVALRSMVLDSNLMDQHTSIFTCKFETVHSNSVRTHIRQWQLAHLGRSRRSATASTRAKNKKKQMIKTRWWKVPDEQSFSVVQNQNHQLHRLLNKDRTRMLVSLMTVRSLSVDTKREAPLLHQPSFGFKLLEVPQNWTEKIVLVSPRKCWKYLCDYDYRYKYAVLTSLSITKKKNTTNTTQIEQLNSIKDQKSISVIKKLNNTPMTNQCPPTEYNKSQ